MEEKLLRTEYFQKEVVFICGKSCREVKCYEIREPTIELGKMEIVCDLDMSYLMEW